MRIIILLGSPGSGKGTQAELLEKNKGFKKLSTGDMLRDHVKQDSDLAREVKNVMERGDLVSDELIIKVIESWMMQDDCRGGIVLDGFPRTLAQAKHLEEILSNKDVFGDAVLDIVAIEVDDEVVIKRISGRFSCKSCMAGYHDEFKKTKVLGVCDNCGAASFVRRKDDNADTVSKRLKNYYLDTAPVIGFYEKNGHVIHKIDGMQDMDLVYKNMLSSIS